MMQFVFETYLSGTKYTQHGLDHTLGFELLHGDACIGFAFQQLSAGFEDSRLHSSYMNLSGRSTGAFNSS